MESILGPEMEVDLWRLLLLAGRPEARQSKCVNVRRWDPAGQVEPGIGGGRGTSEAVVTMLYFILKSHVRV